MTPSVAPSMTPSMAMAAPSMAAPSVAAISPYMMTSLATLSVTTAHGTVGMGRSRVSYHYWRIGRVRRWQLWGWFG